ncbi:MAG: SGNH/GDSL hydrolase family protein [Betaproteobacteria bacterium]
MNPNQLNVLRASLTIVLIVAGFLAAEMVTRVALFGFDALVHPLRYSPRPNTLTDLAATNPDPVLTYRLNPGASGYFKGRRFSVNDGGFRGAPLAPPKPAGVFRIASLGASITMGAGVADQEVYSAALAELLDGVAPGRFEVINASVGGYSARQIAALYDQHVAKYRPDLVLFPVFYSGYQALDDAVPLTYPPLQSFFPARTDLRGYLLDSFLYQGLREMARTWLGSRLSVDWPVRGRPVPPAPPTTADELAKFVAQRHAEGIPVCLLVLHRINEEPPQSDAQYRRRIEEWVRAHPGSCLVDTVPALRGRVGIDDRVYWGDNHPNARIHRLYAEEILRALTHAGLLPGDRPGTAATPASTPGSGASQHDSPRN